MTYAPSTITRLGAYWKQQGGVNLGIVGDAAHEKRASYHNGQDVIAKYGRTALDDYSIRLARDREPHLTNAAAAIDLGKLDGKLSELWRFSNWLVAECLTNATKRRDVREIIYSPNGKTVMRYSGPENAVQVGGGDDSHLWHTHISFYRDSEKRTKVDLFAPFFLPDTSTGDEMYSLPESSGPYPATVDANTPVYDGPTDNHFGQTLNDIDKPFYVIAASKGSTETTGRRCIYGRYSGAQVRLGWVDRGRINAT